MTETNSGEIATFRTPPRAWWAVAMCACAGFMSTLDRKIISVLVDPLRAELQISDVDISLLQGASFTILYAAASIPLGLWADRASRRNLIIWGVSLWSAATIAGGFAAGFGWLFAARMLVGVGEACLSPAVVSLIGDLLPPEKRGRALSLFFMAQAIGTGASVAITGSILELWPVGTPEGWPLIGGHAGWRMAFIICGAIGFLVVAGMLPVTEPPRQTSANRPATSPAAAFRFFGNHAGVFLPIYFGFAMLACANYGMQAWAPTFLMRGHGFSPGEVAAYLGTAAIVAGIAGALIAGTIADMLEKSGRSSAKLLILVGAAIVSLPGALVAFAPGPAAAVVMLGAWIGCFPVFGTATVVVLQDIVPKDMRGIAISLLNVAGTFVGFPLGTFLIAASTEYLYRDPAQVGLSITTVMLPCVIVGAGLFVFARARLIGLQAR